MFFTYHRVGRIPLLPALAVAGAIVVFGGIAATILTIAGVVGFSSRLLRALGLLGTGQAPAARGDGIIEGVVVKRSSAGTLNP